MKFAIIGSEPRGEWAQVDGEEMQRRVRQHQQRLDELVAARAGGGPPGLIFASFGLAAEAEVVTVRREGGGYACVDGPFPETKEVVGGFDIIEFASRQDAIGWTSATTRHPGHAAEIRPLRELWWISGMVDRVRLLHYERRSEAREPGPADPSPSAEVFMLTSVQDAAPSGPSGTEQPQRDGAPQLVVAEYVRQRSMLRNEPGMWVGGRFAAGREATAVRWTARGPVASAGPLAETRALISGFNVVACASRDEAVAWAQRLATRDGVAIEVRPVRGCWWIYHE